MKQRIAVVLGIVVLMALAIVMRQSPSPEPVPEAVSAAPPAPAADPDFSFSRQTIAELAADRQPASHDKPRAQWRPNRKPLPDAFSGELAQAQAETDAAPVYRMIFARLEEPATKTTLARIKELLATAAPGKSAPEAYLALGDAEKQELLELLNSDAVSETMALLGEAAAKGHCDFELDFSLGFEVPLDHLGPMRQLVGLGSIGMLAAVDWNDPESALAMAEAGLQVSRDAGEGDLLITRLVQIASDRLVLESLAAVSQHPKLPAEDAYPLLVEMAKRDYVASMTAAIKREGDLVMTSIDQFVANPEQAVAQAASNSEEAAALTRVLADAELVASNKAAVEDIVNRYLKLGDLPPAQARQAMLDLDTRLGSLTGDDAYFARLLLPAYGRSVGRAHDALAELDATYVDVLTAVYRSQHGRDPQSIGDLESIIEAANQHDRKD